MLKEPPALCLERRRGMRQDNQIKVFFGESFTGIENWKQSHFAQTTVNIGGRFFFPGPEHKAEAPAIPGDDGIANTAITFLSKRGYGEMPLSATSVLFPPGKDWKG